MLPSTADSDSPGKNRSVPMPASAVRWVVRVLALVALLGSSYLAWMSLLAGPDALLGCADLPYFDCGLGYSQSVGYDGRRGGCMVLGVDGL